MQTPEVLNSHRAEQLGAAPDYLTQNKSYYDREFGSGYGHQYPESHVIKIYHRVLAKDLNLTGAGTQTLLDFGCGTGANAAFFASKGFDVYGVDISAVAIQKCRRALPDIAEHFQTVDPKPDDGDLPFEGPFDIVFSNQVLYFLSDSDLAARLRTLIDRLKRGGIFVATMIGARHYLCRHSTPAHDGLRRVTAPAPAKPVQPAARAGQPVFMRFTESEDHLCRQFAGLEPIYIGYYDINLRDDSGFHYVFIGRPANS